MERVSIFGQMDPHTKDSFQKEEDMDKEAGDLWIGMEISMLESIKMIRNADMGDISGLMAVFMRAISKMTKSNFELMIGMDKGS